MLAYFLGRPKELSKISFCMYSIGRQKLLKFCVYILSKSSRRQIDKSYLKIWKLHMEGRKFKSKLINTKNIEKRFIFAGVQQGRRKSGRVRLQTHPGAQVRALGL
jgi:hypothetical protein